MRPETPITRKEIYLARIDGDEVSTPSPISREEIYLAKIAGDDVSIPEPITRYEMYLAGIAGETVNFPAPVTRLEMFLAYAAGIRESAPIPITREEMYWYDYTPAPTIVEITGIPPLTFIGYGDDLIDYRISGNTVQNGEPSPDNPVEVVGVGERTGNLFDAENAVVYKSFINATTSRWADASDGSKVVRIRCAPDTTYSLSISATGIFRIATISTDTIPTSPTPITVLINKTTDNAVFTTPSDAKYILFQAGISIQNIWLSSLMLTPGTTAPDHYIPYGYEVDITTSNGTDTITTPIYIGNEQLMEGEYLSYSEQKIYRKVDGVLTPTDPPVPLPALPTINGTNILSVETEVQPSEVDIKGKIKEIETDTTSNSNAIASTDITDSLKADVMPQYEDTLKTEPQEELLETEPTNKEEI